MKKKNKDNAKIKDFLIQLLIGIIVSLFSFWLNKTFGFPLGAG